MRFCIRRSVARHKNNQIPTSKLVLRFHTAQRLAQDPLAAIAHHSAAVSLCNGQTDAVYEFLFGVLFPEARGAIVCKNIDHNRRGYKLFTPGVDL